MIRTPITTTTPMGRIGATHEGAFLGRMGAANGAQTDPVSPAVLLALGRMHARFGSHRRDGEAAFGSHRCYPERAFGSHACDGEGRVLGRIGATQIDSLGRMHARFGSHACGFWVAWMRPQQLENSHEQSVETCAPAARVPAADVDAVPGHRCRTSPGSDLHQIANRGALPAWSIGCQQLFLAVGRTVAALQNRRTAKTAQVAFPGATHVSPFTRTRSFNRKAGTALRAAFGCGAEIGGGVGA